jgi:hypothetical protein
MRHGKGLSVVSRHIKSLLVKEDGVFGAKKQDWSANGLEEKMKGFSSSICLLASSEITQNGFKPSGQAGIVVGIINNNEQTGMTIYLYRPGPSLFPTINSWLAA